MRNKIYKRGHTEIGVTPLTQSINYGYPSQEMGRLLKMKPIFFASIYKNEGVEIFWDLNYWAKVAWVIINKAGRGTGFFNRLVVRSDKLKNQTIKIIQEYGLTDFNEIPNNKLAEDLKVISYNAFLLSVYSQLGQIADTVHGIFTSTLENIIKEAPGLKKTRLDIGHIFNILTTSTKYLPSDERQIELKSIQYKLKKDSSKRKEFIDRVLSRWFWLNFGHLGPAMSRTEVSKIIDSKIRLKSIKNISKKQITIEKKLGLTAKERRIFEVSRIFVYLKGMREQVCNGVNAFLNKLTKKIQLETGIDRKYLMYLSMEECLDYLQKNKLPSKNILMKRRKLSVWIPKDVFNTEIIIGINADKYIKDHLDFNETNIVESSEISGRVGYPGKVIGRTRIINHVSEIRKIKKGEIMVSLQTMPELLPAMNKASAIITDIGGITSHAAIVSRELKIPCVIGTKIATKVLKDGDKVEVDATNGIIKKI